MSVSWPSPQMNGSRLQLFTVVQCSEMWKKKKKVLWQWYKPGLAKELFWRRGTECEGTWCGKDEPNRVARGTVRNETEKVNGNQHLWRGCLAP